LISKTIRAIDIESQLQFQSNYSMFKAIIKRFVKIQQELQLEVLFKK